MNIGISSTGCSPDVDFEGHYSLEMISYHVQFFGILENLFLLRRCGVGVGSLGHVWVYLTLERFLSPIVFP